MRFKKMLFVLALSCVFHAESNVAVRAAAPGSAPEQALANAVQNGQLTYLVFYRQPDAETDAVVNTVKTFAAERADCTWSTVRIDDPAERPLAERFKLTRAPMPFVLAVHPNGAVTGNFFRNITPDALAKCIVSPKKAECMACLQQQQLVLLALYEQPGQPLPQHIGEWTADPHFGQRTKVVPVSLNDPAEAPFLASMQVDPRQATTMTVLLAPPGVLVGKFLPAASKAQMAAKLAESGKCCDDPNCKHNTSLNGASRPGQVNR